MKDQWRHSTSSNAPVYGLGLVGALVYFISAATGFWGTVIAVLKALVWPAILVYDAFGALAS